MQKLLYRPVPLETEPLHRTILVHGAMHYKCELCGEMYLMWLERGLEDKMQDEKRPELHKPVPFCIGCTCGGTAKHILWVSDIHLDEYRELGEKESYFENVSEEDCGKPHLRSTARKEQEKTFLELPFLTERGTSKSRRHDRDDEDISPIAQGLENYTITQLKAEIRRRKRW